MCRRGTWARALGEDSWTGNNVDVRRRLLVNLVREKENGWTRSSSCSIELSIYNSAHLVWVGETP